MIIELRKSSGCSEILNRNKGTSSKIGFSSSTNRFWLTLPDEAVELLGNRIIVKRNPVTKDFVLSKPDIDSKIKPTVLGIGNTLRIPLSLVDEWNDLGDYEIDIDKEKECVYLIKK